MADGTPFVLYNSVRQNMQGKSAIVRFSDDAQLRDRNGPNSGGSTCQVCHGADGTGPTSAGLKLKVPDDSFVAITKSRKGKMPAYSSRLTDVQIRSVIQYIRKLK